MDFLMLCFYVCLIFAESLGNPNTNSAPRSTRSGEVRDCSDPNNIYLPPTTVETSDRLEDLRKEMQDVGYDAYIVPSEDEHLSEYIAPRDKRRAWITGFSGSAGVAVITATEAALWTDGRYFLQAEMEVDCNWQLMKDGEPGVLSIEEWIVSKLQSDGDVAAANPFVFSISDWQSYESYFADNNIGMLTSTPDLIDLIWLDRPSTLGNAIEIHPMEFAGENWQDKIQTTVTNMKSEGADILLLTSLEEIAWTFNLRGNDIPYIPVFTSYTIINVNANKYATIYGNLTQLQAGEIETHLNPAGCSNLCVEVKAYEDADDDLRTLANNDVKVWMSSEGTTFGMYDTVEETKQISIESPMKVPKAVKNSIQVDAMRKAHIYDAVAMCEYIMWLEENVPLNKVDELSGLEYLSNLRLAQPRSKGLSFGGISAVGSNGAIIHYGSSEDTNKNLTTTDLYLVDTGGQYLEGSTDVTRTLHFGTPTEYEKETFTRVLMGVIDVEMSVFPETADGNYVDVLARQNLLAVGLDFRHSTGHGIGQYLSIHEYPPGIGRVQAEGYPLQIGMFTSNEPGYYEEGKFGIRIENIVVVEKATTDYHFGDYDYHTFVPVTMVPIQKKLINHDLMTSTRIKYLDEYHKKVLETVGPELKDQNKQDVYDWLEVATSPFANSATSLSPNNTLLLIIFASFIVVS